MPRRLPLLGAASVPVAPRAPLVAAPSALGVADAGAGDQALDFALELARALQSAGLPVPLAVLAYGAAPALDDDFGRALAQDPVPLSCHAVAADAPTLPRLAFGGEPALLVGLPALCSFAPWLSIVVGAERPIQGWPAALRARRGHLQLELSTPTRAFAQALAQRLLVRDLLRRG